MKALISALTVLKDINSLRHRINIVERSLCNEKSPLVSIHGEWVNFDDVSTIGNFYNEDDGKELIGSSQAIMMGTRIVRLDKVHYFWKEKTE